MMIPTVLMLLTALAPSLHASTLYFSLPFQTTLNNTSAYHLVPVEINRYPYLIDFTLDSQPDRILSLQTAAAGKRQVERADYRKSEESVFGVVEFYGTQRADARMEWKRRAFYNAYYFARDFLSRETWLALNGVQQLPEVEGPSQGAFNFGPMNTNSQILRTFRRYSKYMGDNVISWRGGDVQQAGQVFFGTFPSQIVQNGEVFSSALEHMGLQHWTVNTAALLLRRRTAAPVDLYRESIKIRLTLSERTVVIPANSAEILVKSLPKCSFQEMTQDGLRGKYLQCKNVKQEQLYSLSLEFALRDSQLPISVHLLDLVLPEEEGRQWFALRASQFEDYQIGQSLLRKYAVGIDYKQARLLYGPLSTPAVLTRNLLLHGFLWGNLLLFVFSLLVVLMEKQLRTKAIASVKEELGLGEQHRPSKANAYELANVSEETLTE